MKLRRGGPQYIATLYIKASWCTSLLIDQISLSIQHPNMDVVIKGIQISDQREPDHYTVLGTPSKGYMYM